MTWFGKNKMTSSGLNTPITTNEYGSDRGVSNGNDARIIDEDYSLGSGVAMRRQDWDRGLGDNTSSHFGKGPKGWRRSDEKIWEDVCEALTHNPVIDASSMEVAVNEGIVSVKGTSETRHVKKLVERLIEDINGVVDIRNELTLTQSDQRPHYSQ
jgi:hypothetical protein